MPQTQIQMVSKYFDDSGIISDFANTQFIEFEFPDKYHLRFKDEGIIEILIHRLNSDIDSTVFTVAKALTKLATKSIINHCVIC